nr:hypothetical protein [Salinibacter ruber]
MARVPGRAVVLSAAVMLHPIHHRVNMGVLFVLVLHDQRLTVIQP